MLPDLETAKKALAESYKISLEEYYPEIGAEIDYSYTHALSGNRVPLEYTYEKSIENAEKRLAEAQDKYQRISALREPFDQIYDFTQEHPYKWTTPFSFRGYKTVFNQYLRLLKMQDEMIQMHLTSLENVKEKLERTQKERANFSARTNSYTRAIETAQQTRRNANQAVRTAANTLTRKQDEELQKVMKARQNRLANILKGGQTRRSSRHRHRRRHRRNH